MSSARRINNLVRLVWFLNYGLARFGSQFRRLNDSQHHRLNMRSQDNCGGANRRAFQCPVSGFLNRMLTRSGPASRSVRMSGLENRRSPN